MRRTAHRQRPRAVQARHLWLLASALVALTPVSWGQLYTPPYTPPEKSGRYQLSGTVVNAATGEPVRRALVQFLLGIDRTMLTDADGRFEFTDLPGGPARITVRKPGFFSEREMAQQQLPGVQSAFRVGPDTGPMVLRLFPEGIIFGRVEAEGEPVEKLPVKIFALHNVNGRKSWEPRGVVSTNDEGEFRFANLFPGMYVVAAGPKEDVQSIAGKSNAAIGRSELFYPGVPDPEAAMPLEIVPGEQVEADFSLKPEPVFLVSGTVAGNPTDAGISLQIVNRTGQSAELPSQIDRMTGKFQISVPAGSYTLRARVEDLPGASWVADVPLAVAGDVAGVRIVLAPEVPLALQVRKDYINPGQAADNGTGSGPPLNVSLFASSPTLSRFVSYGYASSKGRGDVIQIKNLDPGKYAVELAPLGGWYVASAQSGATDLLSDDLTILAGAPSPAIDVVLRNDGATLAGSISSSAGGPSETGAVLLVPHHGKPKVAVAYAGNEFQFSDLAPGDYDVLAFDRIDRLEYNNPEILSAYLGKASHVTLLSNGQSKIGVELIHLQQQ